ncbi:TonB-dependent receptor [Ravibacter arvi]|uniref:TonB-dependent receptor n=1 Tax=Ravibacter arvi TaxID=2051041 RepID=A0ABP8LYK8_9BACT
MQYLFIFSLLMAAAPILGQSVNGKVHTEENQQKTPLVGANVFWKGTTIGVMTNVDGAFSIPVAPETRQLIISFVGYRNDTLLVDDLLKVLDITLKEDQTLSEVTVRGNAGMLDRLSPLHTEIIDTRTLEKAACCNLSESFETNASVSVSFSDAVTGSKQIQMLGLSGNYIQTNTENIPFVRGLATTFGLNYIPGTWVQSIDVNKGVGSVVNGYESMTGQINVELKKPDGPEQLYLNTYVNHFGRGEVNLNLARQLNEKWSTGFLSHASTLRNRVDGNGDNFLDMPLYTQISGLNRWKYQSDNMMAQFGVNALHENRLGGEMNFRPAMKLTREAYGFGTNVNRAGAFAKIARLYPHKPYQGLGLILNASYHDQDSYLGLTRYDATQKSLYGNLIYQNIIGNTQHSYRTGVSYMLDNYREVFKDTLMRRTESVPGAFFEYTYNYIDKFVAVLGSRLDAHNLYGLQFIPRAHLKYGIDNHTVLRLAGGKGFRVANPLAENYGNLVSSRRVIFRETLQPEVSWNYGISLSRDLHLNEMKASVVVDFFRTHFENQLVADMEDHRYLYFYNLNGKAFANSFQAEFNLVPVKRLEFKLAYRFFDNKQSITTATGETQLLPRMMVSRDRVLFNTAYALPYDKWKFDLTVQWNGQKRMPMTAREHAQPETGIMPVYMAPDFFNVNAQITRTFPKWDLYLGGENLTGFRQMNPIVEAQNPFGPNFDAGMAWGPVVGRMIYAGLRFKIGE